MLDDAGFNKTKLVASNDLDEHLIENLLLVQKAPYDIMAPVPNWLQHMTPLPLVVFSKQNLI